MKTNVFEKLIRKVVREEIDYALQREIRSLKEDLRNELKPTITEQRTSIPKNVQNSLKEKIMGKKPISKNFVSNNTLNDLLNETAQGDTNLEKGTNPVNLSQPFNSSSPMPIEAMPTEVATAVNRDYRELMRAMDKRKTHRP